MRRLVFVVALIAAAALAATAQQRFVAALDGLQEVPTNFSNGKGVCHIVLNAAQTQITVNCTFSGLSTNLQAAHIHGNAAPGVNAPVLFGFTGLPAATSGSIGPLNFAVTPAQVADMRAHRYYVNLHTTFIPGGEIRGQVKQAFTVYDVDGDGRSDASTFRQSNNTFYAMHSKNGGFTTYPIGSGAGDIFLNSTADFDGDGRGDPLLIKLEVGTNVAIWTIYQTGSNTLRSVRWGNFSAGTGETLAINDYDGDGSQDIAIFRRSNGQWWILESSTGGTRVDTWGATNDFPSIGDYDGDGKADLTAVRVETGQRVWYIRNSADGSSRRVIFGSSATDGVFFFAPFDVDGDGRQDIAVNRIVSAQRVFHVLRSSDGMYIQMPFGASTDTAMFGDYDGDGKTDLVARRNVGGILLWQIQRSSDGVIAYIYWGITGDQVVDGDAIEASLQGGM